MTISIPVVLLIGLISGITITTIVHRFVGTLGVLRIDHSDPAKDVYRLEINDLDKIKNKTRIVLEIDHNADLSHQ